MMCVILSKCAFRASDIPPEAEWYSLTRVVFMRDTHK